MADEHKDVEECETCAGRGIVDVGTCPDCLGSGDDTDARLAFEQFINGNVAKRLGEGEIEEHVLTVIWDTKLYPWARDRADKHLAESPTRLEIEESDLCAAHECGGCREGDPPCESYKLWAAGMWRAAALVAEELLSKKVK